MFKKSLSVISWTAFSDYDVFNLYLFFSGVLSLAHSLDFEIDSKHTIQVTVSDSSHVSITNMIFYINLPGTCM